MFSMDKNKIIYVKITSLTNDELPIEYIEGRVTSGSSVNLEGNSSVRRSCNLSLIVEDGTITNAYWGLNTKFRLETGEQTLDSDIKWRSLGIYLIASFRTNKTVNSLTVSISGKDKMCRLNGDLGGQLFASVDFGYEEREEITYLEQLVNEENYQSHTYYILQNGEYIFDDEDIGFNSEIKYYSKFISYIKEPIPIQKIIREAVHAYALEPYHNIIINDLDTCGLELLRYNGKEPFWAVKKHNDDTYDNIIMNKEKVCYYQGQQTTLEALTTDNKEVEEVYFSNIPEAQAYDIKKISSEDSAVGYRTTDLVYNGDLIAAIGETITSILDKIVQMLGDFEYFYDVDGHFVFQRKPIYVNTSWSLLEQHGTDITIKPALEELSSPIVYNFDSGDIEISISNDSNIQNIRNDFAIWGVRKTSDGAEIPIHARYAIDTKPMYYKALDGTQYVTQEYLNDIEYYLYTDDDEEFSVADTPSGFEVRDWRELIYQMAKDYFAGQGSDKAPVNLDNGTQLTSPDNFLSEVACRNPDFYPTGYTGYEQYYTDIEGFWRTLYNPQAKTQTVVITPGHYISDQYIINETTGTSQNVMTYINAETIEECEYETDAGEYLYWNKKIQTDPESLIFWFDFLDNDSDMTQYNVKLIGIRSKVAQDSQVNAIFYSDVPDLLYETKSSDKYSEERIKEQTGYNPVNIPDYLESQFFISYRGKSAKEVIDSYLQNYVCFQNTVNINCLPLYWLQPNTRIKVVDDDLHLKGQFIVEKITIPLGYNGTMQISASAVPDRIM